MKAGDTSEVMAVDASDMKVDRGASEKKADSSTGASEIKAGDASDVKVDSGASEKKADRSGGR